MERGIRLIGNGQAPVHKYWEDLLKMIQEKKFDPTIMLSHRVDVSELDEVYKRFDSREKGMQKVFVQTKFSDPGMQGGPELTLYKK